MLRNILIKGISILIFALLAGLYLLMPAHGIILSFGSSGVSDLVVFMIISCSLLILLLVRAMAMQQQCINIQGADVMLGLVLVYIGINRYFLQPVFELSLMYYELIFLGVLYLILRNYLSVKLTLVLYLTLVVAGIVHAVWGNFQLMGFSLSNNANFKVTGVFKNPGPYSGYLASIFPVCGGLYLFAERIGGKLQLHIWNAGLQKSAIFLIKSSALIGIVCILLIMPFAQSRSAIISVIISSLFLASRQEKLHRIMVKVLKTIRQNLIYALLFVSVFLLAIAGLYHMKKGSSDGRILIWKNTLSMIGEHPVTGVGYDRFQAAYMNSQGQYFRHHMRPDEVNVADDVMYAFNDTLQFITEQGIIGGILLIGLGICLFKLKCKDEDKHLFTIAQAGLTGILVFSLSAYPSQVLPVKINMILYMAILVSYSVNARSVLLIDHPGLAKTMRIGALSALAILLITLGINLNSNFHESDKDYLASFLKYNTTGIVSKDPAVHDILRLQSSSNKNKYVRNIVAARVDSLSANNSVTQMQLGDNYKALGDYKNAERAYLNAWYMIPSRFYPKYLLAKMYFETKQYAKALNIAKELVGKDVKIESGAVNQIKHEMQQMVAELEKKR